MTSHHLQLDDNQLILMTEYLGVAYLRVQVAGVLGRNHLPTAVFVKENTEAIRALLREMLHEPLRSRTFRRQLLEHFATHPHPLLKEDYTEFLVEALTWDS